MSPGNPNIRILAFLCDNNGIVIQLLRNDLALNPEEIIGFLFTRIFHQDSHLKALSFFLDIKSQRYTSGCELNALIHGKPTTLYFTGAFLEDSVLIFGADLPMTESKVTEQLLMLNNEQANEIRKYIKDLNKQIDFNRKNEVVELFNEISKLNNELINLHRQLEKKNSELMQLNEMKNKFLGMAAHDLRNPLSVITSYASFLALDAREKLTPEHLRFLEIIGKSAKFMLEIIEDMLDYSKIEAGKIELNPQKTDLISFIRQNIELNQLLANKKNIKLNFNTNIKTLSISFDINKITQVLNNLISNAIKFSYENAAIDISCMVNDDNIRISVKDDGIGIGAEHLESIFQPFQTFGIKGTAGEKGTGLGLFIVKKIIEAHGGKIWVESEKDKGTVFMVDMPLKLKTHNYE